MEFTEGITRSVSVSVTNNAKRTGSPLAVRYTIRLIMITDDGVDTPINYWNGIDFLAGETKTLTYPWIVPIGTVPAGQTSLSGRLAIRITGVDSLGESHDFEDQSIPFLIDARIPTTWDIPTVVIVVS